MEEHAGGTSPPRSTTDDELDALWVEYAGHCTDLRNHSARFWLTERVLARLRIRPSGALGALTGGLAGGVPPLVVALVVAALAGQWSSAPMWRWTVVSVWIGVTWVIAILFMGASIAEQFSMDRALTKPADLRREIDFVHRWATPRSVFAVSASYALVCLAIIGLFAGERGIASVPAGSVALLVIVLYDLGELTYGSLRFLFGLRISSELDYRVSWPSPLDSPWVRPALRGQAQIEIQTGVMVTGDIAVVAVLLSLGSPLLLPSTVMLLATGYAAILALVVSARLCFHRIVTRAKEARLVDLQTRIDAFGERPEELEKARFGELTRLMELRDLIDRSPTNLRARDGLARLVTSLALPTLTFVATVVAEEYFGRFVAKFLP